MKLKKLLATLAATTLVFSLVACGGGGTSDSGSTGSDTKSDTSNTSDDAGTAGDTGDTADTGSDDSAAGGSEELTVWCWDPAFNIYAMQEAEKVYQKDHPNFKLNIQEVLSEDLETKITTAAASGDLSTLPDIFLMQDNSYQKFLANFPEVFTDITSTGIDFASFGEAKVAYSVKDGKNYGVPFDNGAAVLALRTDLIEQAGLKVEDFTDITWSKFIELGKQVKEATGLPMLTQQAGSPDLACIMLQSCGASMLNEDGTANIEGNASLKKVMEVYVELVKEGIMLETTDWDQYVASINNGTVAGTLNGCWILASVQLQEEQSGKWAVTNIPSLDGIEGATNYSNNGGSSWAISANCQNVDLAADFLSKTFAGSVEFYETILPKSGALATYLPAGESDVYNEPQDFFGGQTIFADITEFAGKIPSNITGAYYYNARDAIGVALTNVIQTGADLDAEIKTAQETVDFEASGQ